MKALQPCGAWFVVLGAVFVGYALIVFAERGPLRLARGWRPVLPLSSLGVSLVVLGLYVMRP